MTTRLSSNATGKTASLFKLLLATALLVSSAFFTMAVRAEVVTIGIGIQNTTTNTVTAGIVIEKLGLLEKYLPKTGKSTRIFSSRSIGRTSHPVRQSPTA